MADKYNFVPPVRNDFVAPLEPWMTGGAGAGQIAATQVSSWVLLLFAGSRWLLDPAWQRQMLTRRFLSLAALGLAAGTAHGLPPRLPMCPWRRAWPSLLSPHTLPRAPRSPCPLRARPQPQSLRSSPRRTLRPLRGAAIQIRGRARAWLGRRPANARQTPASLDAFLSYLPATTFAHQHHLYRSITRSADRLFWSFFRACPPQPGMSASQTNHKAHSSVLPCSTCQMQSSRKSHTLSKNQRLEVCAPAKCFVRTLALHCRTGAIPRGRLS